MGTSELDNIASMVRLAKTGDKEALSLLIEATQDRFYKFIFGVTGNKHIADDVCQESYLRALEHLDKLRDDSKFISWLYRTGKNAFLDHLKQRSNKNVSINDTDLNDARNLGSEAVDNIIYINQVLQSLGEEERMVLLAVDMEGNTYAEAAELLDITEEAVRMKLFRARKKFVENFETSKEHVSSIKWENENEFKKGI